MKLTAYQKRVVAAFTKELLGKEGTKEENNKAFYWFTTGWAACCDDEANELKKKFKL